ncbi:hypothetical protein ACKU27_13615 [Sphingobium yanoikuyae]|uniref:hypothetical protein n=1 Tax=Sphingobium yanoikuyae TaxID=13690 RepID=UPI003B8F44F2
MTTQARFTQADITRVMKSAVRAGVPHFTITIDPAGSIVFEAGQDDVARENSMDAIMWPDGRPA